MNQRRINKKAQEAVSNFGVTGIVLIVFLVVVVLGIWYVNSSWNQVSDQIPKNAAIIASACSSVARETTLNSYCFQFREVNKNIYTTCDYAKKYNIVILDSDNSNASIIKMNNFCLEYKSNLEGSIKNFCEEKEWSSKVEVNGKKCSDWKNDLFESNSEIGTTYSGLLEFKVEGDFEVLSDEECRSGLEQRKKDLGIPDKLCYWQAITEVYDERCENLDRAQISEIFEKKEEYRQLNNPDWPSLNTEGDFCVPVTYDCEGWDSSKKDKAKIGGFYNAGSALYPQLNTGIYVNPYLAMNKGLAQNTILLHEGLHAVQNKLMKNTHLAEGEKYVGLMGEYDTLGNIKNQNKVYIIRDEMVQYQDILAKKEEGVIEKIGLGIESIASQKNISNQDEEKMEEFYNEILNLNIEFIAGTPRMGVYEPVELEKLFVDDIKTPLVKYNLWDAEAESAYNKLLELNNQSYLLIYEYKVKGYVGSKIEVDPRLSEVQRWWLEKTAPNCEIIYTPEKAKEVLYLFLEEKNLPAEYKWSQKDLGLLLYVYKGTEYEDDVYNDLINRLPGLASNDEPIWLGSDDEEMFV